MCGWIGIYFFGVIVYWDEEKYLLNFGLFSTFILSNDKIKVKTNYYYYYYSYGLKAKQQFSDT